MVRASNGTTVPAYTMKTFRERTCLKCGWVHFGVSREFAQDEVARFNSHYVKLSPQEQEQYYGGKPASITAYERCMACGNGWENFRDFQPGDCPDGCTLNPIIFVRATPHASSSRNIGDSHHE